MARTLRILLVVALLIVVGLGAYVGYAAIRAAQPVTLPAPTGPHPVGRTITEWTDHARLDPLAPQPGSPRRLSVWLWYPAAPAAEAGTAPYAPGAWAGLHLDGALAWSETGFDDVHVHAVADVPVAAGRFPVVVLEPGLGFAAPQYTAIAENLASHGYLVAGVTPTYSANLTVLDGTAVPSDEAGNPSAFDTADLHAGQAQVAGDRLVDVWAADARFAAAQTAGLQAQGRFAGHVDTAATVYIGHSFGGAAALEACRSDPHCTGAADLDGTQYGAVVHSGLTKPLLLIGSQDSCVTGTCEPSAPGDQADRDAARSLVNAGTGPVWCYRIRGAEHFDFTDYGAYYFAAPAGFLLALGSIDGDLALAIVNAYLGAFVDHAVSGRPAALLAAPSPYAEVEVQRTAS
ncbi:alpha/beta hydrolase [Amycolatopsis sp. NBC_00355]|uniref:alpha/beta hydrolase n=1 Tax=Amycolatopsis sp. NBC_00355 TaxID=2975957 RepID=UPI002E26FD8E